MTPFTTRRTVYRKTSLTVTLSHDGTLLCANISYPEVGVTELLTDEQKDELAAQVRREIEEEV